MESCCPICPARAQTLLASHKSREHTLGATSASRNRNERGKNLTQTADTQKPLLLRAGSISARKTWAKRTMEKSPWKTGGEVRFVRTRGRGSVRAFQCSGYLLQRASVRCTDLKQMQEQKEYQRPCQVTSRKPTTGIPREMLVSEIISGNVLRRRCSYKMFHWCLILINGQYQFVMKETSNKSLLIIKAGFHHKMSTSTGTRPNFNPRTRFCFGQPSVVGSGNPFTWGLPHLFEGKVSTGHPSPPIVICFPILMPLLRGHWGDKAIWNRQCTDRTCDRSQLQFPSAVSVVAVSHSFL